MSQKHIAGHANKETFFNIDVPTEFKAIHAAQTKEMLPCLHVGSHTTIMQLHIQ